MPKKTGFRSQAEEVSRLLDELAALKEIMREISGKLTKLELRAKRAFPDVAAKKQIDKTHAATRLAEASTLSAQQALNAYDRIVQSARDGRNQEAIQSLEAMSLQDLLLLFREVGLTLGKSKPSKKLLINSILGRVKQSLMLSRQSNRSS